MTFDEILEQVITLLKRQGRVSYRALKMRLDIDDEYLDVLKEELLYVHPVVDDEGKGLIWTGEAETKAETKPASTSTQLTQQEGTQQDQLAPVEPPVEPRPREAERRQLTVMFCDLVDSTKLSSQLDPEDYREVVREYQRVCSEVITRFDGHIAQYLGDGLLVYFGYPQSHEDEAQRAVYTGLGILNTLKQLNTRLEPDKGIRLALRIGIHTGLVVVGDIGTGAKQEQLALGETPNIAARIQGLAEPDTVVISAATYRLVQGYFTCQAMGEQTLRGVSQPIMVYQVLQESGVQNRLDVASTRGLTPLVGRESEVTLLLERWYQAKDGQGQVILLSGEAGIGKSRLVQVLKDHIASEPHVRWECRSSPYYQNTALYPLIDLLQRALQWQQDDTPEQRLGKLEQTLSQYRLSLEETIPLFAPLLSLSLPDDRYPPLNLSPQRQRQKTLESIVAILLELAEREPVLYILEDLHWTDPTTLEFLGLLVEQVPTAAIYPLLTCRPHFQPDWHHRSYLTEITVNRLSREQIERMAQHVAGGKMLPMAIIQQLVDKTDGVPLYVEEMTKAILEAGHLTETNEHYELTGSLSSLAIPTTLQDSLMARLDRLVTAKAVAQYASVIGRQFSYVLLQAVSGLDEPTLQRELSRLVEAELLYQRGLPPQATYTFKHALIQDTAYESLLRSTRQGYHRRIAEVLEERFPETVQIQPELLAHHYTEADLNEKAVIYWHQAGQRAIARSAHQEAINHLRKGLAVLMTLPDTPERVQHELQLHVALGTPLMATQGFTASEVGQVYARARELCQRMGDTPQSFPVLRGLWRSYQARGDLRTARELAEHCLDLAQHTQDPDHLVEACEVAGITFYHLGDLVTARPHFEHGIALYDAQRHHALTALYGEDPGVACLSRAAHILWMLGYPEQALQCNAEALTLACDLSHPFSVGYALTFTAQLYHYRREWQMVQEQSEAAIALSTEHGFPTWLTTNQMLLGGTLVAQGHHERGMAQGLEGMTANRALGRGGNLPYYLTLMAEAYGMVGQIDAGLAMLNEALSVAEETEVRYYEPEIHRLKGELLLQQSPTHQTEAEACYQNALEVSRHQQAKSLELRAATSLAKLWQRQGKRQDAYDLLAPVYNWFTEGFDTADLKDAKALLDVLR